MPNIILKTLGLSLLLVISPLRASDNFVLVKELTLAQLILSNALPTIATIYAANRENRAIGEYTITQDTDSPIESIRYGFAAHDNDECQKGGNEPPLDNFIPCLAAQFPGRYLVEVRFKSSYANSASLSSYARNKKVVFIAINIDNVEVTDDFSAQTASANSRISYFTCYNPTLISEYADDDGIDQINNGVRLGGNIDFPARASAIAQADSPVGGINACLGYSN